MWLAWSRQPYSRTQLMKVRWSLLGGGEESIGIKIKMKGKGNHSPRDNFSPESGGNVNPNKAIDAIRTHGTIKLKK